MDVEYRVIELETKVSYQEHLLQELNDVITAQQTQVDGLEKELKRMRDYMRGQQGSGLARPDEEAPPPHY